MGATFQSKPFFPHFFNYFFIFIIVFFPIIETEKVQETQASSPYESNYSKRQKNWFGIGFLFKSNKTARGERDTNNESYIDHITINSILSCYYASSHLYCIKLLILKLFTRLATNGPISSLI